MTFKYGELFCGPGGLAWGAKQATVKNEGIQYKIVHEWASDYDEDSCKTYSKNICPDAPNTIICKDVRELDIKELNEIDAFAYGFPCNDFSVVGEQKGFDGNFGPLYTYGIGILNKFKPKFFIAENVGGLTSVNEGQAFKKILADLLDSGNGYKITPHLYRAEDYGVPQTRHRVIVVGIDRSLGLTFQVPAPTHAGKYATVREALEKPPIPQDAVNNEKMTVSKKVIERLSCIKPGENAWTAKLPEHLRLNVKNAKMSQIYKKLHPESPSYTITGSGGGGTHGYHYKEPRALTNRERARIQTFPDNYIFEGNPSSVRKQIGMAVPPLLSKIIFTSVLNTFAGERYPYIHSNLSYKQPLL